METRITNHFCFSNLKSLVMLVVSCRRELLVIVDGVQRFV